MLGVMAAFEGMILRREAQLAIMGVQVLFIFLAFIIFDDTLVLNILFV